MLFACDFFYYPNTNLSRNDKNILTFDLFEGIIQLKREANFGNSFGRELLIMKKETLVKLTKYLLDFMYYSGMVLTVSLPFTIKMLGKVIEKIQDNYLEVVIIYFVLGIAAIAILGELRKIFKTVVNKNCFVHENVISLNKMCKWSFFIVTMSIVRSLVYVTPAMLVVILVFIIAGLFSKVLSFVFEEAVGYKEENDFTI